MSKSKSETDQLREGTRVFVHGEAAYLWIQDYNGLVFTMGTVMRTPKPTDKKVLVILDMLGEVGCGRNGTPHRAQNCQAAIHQGGRYQCSHLRMSGGSIIVWTGFVG